MLASPLLASRNRTSGMSMEAALDELARLQVQFEFARLIQNRSELPDVINSWHSVLQQLPATKLIKCHVVITII
jgi:hypothetical protein